MKDMKQICNKRLLAMAAIVALLLSGCTKELHNEGFGEGSYLSLSIDGQQTPSAAMRGASTRATAVNESAVSNVWVLQFQMTSATVGTLVNKAYIATVTDPTKIKYPPVSGSNMMLYLVANTGNSTLFSSTGNGTTLANVKKIIADVTATLPMVGQSATNLTLPTTSTVSVSLTRTVAKVTLTVTNKLTSGYPQLSVTSTQLKNVPKKYSMQVVNSTNGFTGANYYPSADATNFTNCATTTSTTSTYYIAPNVRGVGTNTDPRLKTNAIAPSGQGNFCTYVEILGKARATSTSPEVAVCYRLYLGGNNTNDFNLYSNTVYTVGVALTGLSASDARLTITTDKFDLAQGGIDGKYEDDIIGWRSPAVRDYYFTDGTTSPRLESGKTVNGIIYYVDPANSSKFKVMALDQGSGLTWSKLDSYVLGSSEQESMIDGKKNVADMKAYSTNKGTGVFATDFPAAEFCDRKNTGGVTDWYLPTKNELQYLQCAYNGVSPEIWGEGDPPFTANSMAQTEWRSLITMAAGDPFPLEPSFWSSTEYAAATQYAHVRCVRDIN